MLTIVKKTVIETVFLFKIGLSHLIGKLSLISCTYLFEQGNPLQ